MNQVEQIFYVFLFKYQKVIQKKNENVYELTPEIYKTLTYTTYNGSTLIDENEVLMMYNIKRDLGYNGIGDRDSKRKIIFTTKLPKLGNDIQTETSDEISDYSDGLQGEGIEKIILPSNIIDIYTSFEVLLGQKISGHSDTLREATNLIDELYKRGEIRNKQQYCNALDKFKI